MYVSRGPNAFRQMALAVASSCRPLPPRLMSPILARNILHKSRLRFHSTPSIPQTHAIPRPYTFHIGASWAGKDDPNKIKSAFPPDTLIGTWRDKTLSRPKAIRSQGAGEDFFFVQEVLYLYMLRDSRTLLNWTNRCGINQ